MVDRKGTVAVIGAGIIGCCVAYALAREGRKVVIFDREDPGMGGASYGNAGHIAAELVEPLPSVDLLLNFWRELTIFDGPLEVPMRRWLAFLPWAVDFAAAAFCREENTKHLAPLVRHASTHMAEWLQEVGRPELLRRNGHYEIWLDREAAAKSETQRRHMDLLDVACVPAPGSLLDAARSAAKATTAAGLWFPDTAHVLDPLRVVRAFFEAAVARGASFRRQAVRELHTRGEEVEIRCEADTVTASAAVVCAGAWSASLLKPLGLHVPLEAACGYHVELPNHQPLVDAPVLYANDRLLVTPMAERLRASSYLEFAGADSPLDRAKPDRMRTVLRSLGYRVDDEGTPWKGARPVLPDYLPALGRLKETAIFYAFGHQHIGLTLAPITGDIMAAVVAGREPQSNIAAFDLARFAPSNRANIPPHG